eukprot:TRINITY_DN66482_c2_g1_i2.p1 TRINITY_DN66482_c2_g1~~TRINITY_DN66482_c2_g1_i2.p1  ORF type:complete len:401 (+),score=154.45 TRINITY_DN66482_c2_g1_i2:3-1205(+)
MIPGVRGPVPEAWRNMAARVYETKATIEVHFHDEVGKLVRMMKETMTDPRLFDRLTKLLHDWGALLYYKGETQTAVCFDPHWLSLALRRVVNEQNKRQLKVSNGVVQRRELERVWSDFAAPTRQNLLFVLRMNKLSFPVGDVGEKKELIPCLITRPTDESTDKAVAAIQARSDYLTNRWVLKHSMKELPRELFGVAMVAVVTGVCGCDAVAWWQNRVHLRVNGTVDAMLSLENQGNDGVLQLMVHDTKSESVLGKLSDALEVGMFGAHRHLGGLVKDRLVSCKKCAKTEGDCEDPEFLSLHRALKKIKSRLGTKAVVSAGADGVDEKKEAEEGAGSNNTSSTSHLNIKKKKAASQPPLADMSCLNNHRISPQALFSRIASSPQSVEFAHLIGDAGAIDEW